MSCRHCFIVPPHLLRALSQAPQVPEAVRASATKSLAHAENIIANRTSRFLTLAQPHGSRTLHSSQPQSIIPPYLLQQISESPTGDEESRTRALRSLQLVEDQIARRHKPSDTVGGSGSTTDGHAADAASTYRAVYDAQHDDNENNLPGTLMRSDDHPDEANDASVKQAFDNVGFVVQFYKDIFNWNSVDNANLKILSSVHYGQNYENAFWDSNKRQMVFGDGDNFLGNFTAALDVIGHEMTHGVTEYTAPLEYNGQSGALNEHVSDVFGIMIKQRVAQQTAEQADWLIGEDCLLPGVKGVALRSMKAPGTAYDDPRFGKDPQPASFQDYKPTDEDNGGVHLFSGIPNRAFYLAAVGFGGYSWEKAGQIWWKSMMSGRIAPKCNFVQFADVTVEIAQETFGPDAAQNVRAAWDQVGVSRQF